MTEKLMKIKYILACWKFRRLSILGKIVVLKSLVASQLVYILSTLKRNHQAIKEINNLFNGNHFFNLFYGIIKAMKLNARYDQ